jgi:hypothetical protein
MSAKGGIAKVKEYALSDADITEILGPTSIFPYPALEGMESIDDVFDDQGRAIILFPNVSPTSGHWCCMIRRPDRIEFFDSYGEAPEDQKDGLSRSRLEALDIERPLLTQLMRASGIPVYYNTHQFQSNKMSVATCGRHCVVRLLYAPYSLKKYKAIIDKSGLSADDFVTGVVFDKIKK